MPASAPIVEPLLAFTWRCWTRLGVRGAVTTGGSSVALAVEELMLLTAQLGSHDPRLRDESLDWCVRNHQFIAKPRLKALLKRLPPRAQSAFAVWGGTLSRRVGGNWPASTSGSADLTLSGKSSAPNLAHPELLNLKLRALFGVGARADVLFTLLAWPNRAFVASDLTTTGYSKRNIALVLEWFGNAGLLTELRRGNRLEFSWQRRPQLVELVQPLPRYFPQWPELLQVWSRLLQLVTDNELRSARLAHVATSKLLQELQQELHQLQLTPPRDVLPDWPAVQDWIAQEARRLEQGTSPALRARTAPGHK